MGVIPSFATSEFRSKQILDSRNSNTQETIGLFRAAVLPMCGKFLENRTRHQVHMPPVAQFELAANHGIVTEHRDFLIIRDRIDVHAVFRKRFVQSGLSRMPQQARGADQNHGTGGLYLRSPIDKPVFHLKGKAQFSFGHTTRHTLAAVPSRSPKYHARIRLILALGARA